MAGELFLDLRLKEQAYILYPETLQHLPTPTTFP